MTTFASLADDPMSPSPCPLAAARELGAVRAQAALVRSLLDELDDLAPSSSARFAEAFAAQAIEELAQLAHRMMQAAVSLSPQRIMELRLELARGSL
jgi:hypothetical protein